MTDHQTWELAVSIAASFLIGHEVTRYGLSKRYARLIETLISGLGQHVAENGTHCFTQSYNGTVRCDDPEGLQEVIEERVQEVLTRIQEGLG